MEPEEPEIEDLDSNSVIVTSIKGKVSSEGIQKNTEDSKVNYMSVSQTQKYFAVGTTSGFEIIQNDSNMSKKKLKKKTVNIGESISMIEMMYKSNFIALVFEKDKNKVIIWDDYEERTRTEISFHSDVKNIKLSKDHLVVVLDEKVFVFNFENLK